jgi:hypothetical protein
MHPTPDQHPPVLHYTTARPPAGRVRHAIASAARILPALSAGLVLVIVLPIAALCVRETGEYRAQFDRESAVLRAALDADPARYAGVTVEEYSSTGIAGLYGTVATTEDRTALVQALTPHFGSEGARMRVQVKFSQPTSPAPGG